MYTRYCASTEAYQSGFPSYLDLLGGFLDTEERRRRRTKGAVAVRLLSDCFPVPEERRARPTGMLTAFVDMLLLLLPLCSQRGSLNELVDSSLVGRARWTRARLRVISTSVVLPWLVGAAAILVSG